MESIELKHLTTGRRSRHFFGSTAGWFYLHFSGDEGYWEITVKTMEGERFTASFYCSGCTGYAAVYRAGAMITTTTISRFSPQIEIFSEIS